MTTLRDRDNLHEITLAVEDRGSQFWEMVAEELARLEGVPVTDEHRAIAREASLSTRVEVVR